MIEPISPSDAQRAAGAASAAVLFVRCARIPVPVRLQIQHPFASTSVSWLKTRFLAEIEHQLPPQTSPADSSTGASSLGRTCRLIARGRELVDGTCLSLYGLESGDHLHALVTDAAGQTLEEQRGEAAVSTTASARQWIMRSVERIGAESRRIAALDGNGGAAAAPPSPDGREATGAPRVMRLVDELIVPSPPATADGGAAGAAVLAIAAESDLMFVVGALLGLFVGFPSLLTLAMDGPFPKLRIGCVFGISVNVILATLLSAPMHVPVRHEE